MRASSWPPLVVVAALGLGWSPDALAQDDEPIGWLVADLRGSLVPYRQNVDLAFKRGYNPSITPSVGLGFETGAHFYFFRWRVITFGVGGSFHTSLGDRRAKETDPDPDGPILRKTFTAVSPQLSFNFGGHNGWSYVSGGLGTSRLSLFTPNEDEPPQRSANTLNYGGGARWFVNPHVAFSLDLRFYAMSPLEQTDTARGSPRMTVMVLSIGASFK